MNPSVDPETAIPSMDGDIDAVSIASILNERGSFSRMQVWLNEARRHGIVAAMPQVNVSAIAHRGEVGGAVGKGSIRIGLSAVRNIGTEICAAIVDRRNADGDYSSLADFLDRAMPGRDEARRLARSGCLDGLPVFPGCRELTRPQILWSIHHLYLSRKRARSNGFFPDAFPGQPDCIGDYSPYARLLDELDFLGCIISRAPASLFASRAARIARRRGLPDPIPGSRIPACAGRRVCLTGTIAEFHSASAGSPRSGWERRWDATHPDGTIMRIEDETAVFECLIPDTVRRAEEDGGISNARIPTRSPSCKAFLIFGTVISGAASTLEYGAKLPRIVAEKVFRLDRRPVS